MDMTAPIAVRRALSDLQVVYSIASSTAQTSTTCRSGADQRKTLERWSITLQSLPFCRPGSRCICWVSC